MPAKAVVPSGIMPAKADRCLGREKREVRREKVMLLIDSTWHLRGVCYIKVDMEDQPDFEYGL